MSPMRCLGIGLSDGEVLERMWSYLRRFGRMTKEMRPSHRVDIITHALLHYGHKTKQKLGRYIYGNNKLIFYILFFSLSYAAKLLVQRWKRAQDTFALADQSLKQALSDYKGLFAYVVSFCYLHLHALQCVKLMFSK